MKKLEDIPKKNIFEVPEGYFDRLPGVIQSRISEHAPSSVWAPYARFSVRYALPLLVAGLAAFFYLRSPSQSGDELFASVDSNDLVAYLEESDMTTEDLLESISLDDEDVEALRASSMDELDLEGIDTDKLSDELGVDYF